MGLMRVFKKGLRLAVLEVGPVLPLQACGDSVSRQVAGAGPCCLH